MELERARARMIHRMLNLDAEEDPEDEDDDPEEEKKGFGGKNTRLPFGLCKRFGIDLPDGATPRDAWDALSGKGVSAREAYTYLQKHGSMEGFTATSPKDRQNKSRQSNGALGFTKNLKEFGNNDSLPEGVKEFKHRVVRFKNLHSGNDSDRIINDINNIIKDNDAKCKNGNSTFTTPTAFNRFFDKIVSFLQNTALEGNIVLHLDDGDYIKHGNDDWEKILDCKKGPEGLATADKENVVIVSSDDISVGLVNTLLHHHPHEASDSLVEEYEGIEGYIPDNYTAQAPPKEWNPCTATNPPLREPPCLKEYEHKATLKEAGKYLNERIGMPHPVAYGHPKYFTVEHANKVNDAILSIMDAYGIKKLKFVGYANTKKGAAYVTHEEGGEESSLYLNNLSELQVEWFYVKAHKDTYQTIKTRHDEISAAKEEFAKYDSPEGEKKLQDLQKQLREDEKKYGPFERGKGSYRNPEHYLESVIVHEMAHVLINEKRNTVGVSGIKKVFERVKNSDDKYKLTGYAFENDDYNEFFAECFAIYNTEENHNLPDDVCRMIEQFME